MRRRCALLIVAGCGRLGFEAELPDATSVEGTPKPDATTTPSDAGPGVDVPPGFGSYQVIESTAPYVAPMNAVSVPGFTSTADDEAFDLSLPFTFTFYGIPFDRVAVSVNGYLTFGTPPSGAASYTNDCPFDATAPEAVIAVFWDDLFASPANGATLSYGLEGVAPDRRLAIEWRQFDAYYHAGSGNNSFGQGIRVTQKIVLHERTDVIELHYGPRTGSNMNKDCGTDRFVGCSATVGLEASGGAASHLVQCGTEAGPKPGYAPLVDGRLVTFVPN